MAWPLARLAWPWLCVAPLGGGLLLVVLLGLLDGRRRVLRRLLEGDESQSAENAEHGLVLVQRVPRVQNTRTSTHTGRETSVSFHTRFLALSHHLASSLEISVVFECHSSNAKNNARKREGGGGVGAGVGRLKEDAEE